jgi:hypothetical protein
MNGRQNDGVLDLRAIVQTAVEAVRLELLRELPGILRAELEQHRQKEWLTSADLAARHGKTVEAFNVWLRRKGGAHLRAIAVEHAGRRRWRRVDVERLEADGCGR